MAFSSSAARKRRAVFGLVVGGACAAALAPIGCSSDATTKKNPTKFTPDGGNGEAGESTSGGSTSIAGSSSVAGTTGHAGAGNTGGGGSGATSGSGATGGEAGASIGEGGAAGTPNLCPSGFGDCDANPADCETPLNLLTSCGACGKSCDGSHATVACTNLKCVVSACAANYGDCDGDGATGCEALINTDTQCGSCTRNCAAAGSTCSNSKCLPVTVSTTGGAGYQAVVHGDSIYIMNTGSMPPGNYTTTRLPLAGGPGVKITDNESGGPGIGVLNVDDSFVYWSVSGNPNSVLKKSITAAAADFNTVVFHPVATVRYLTIIGAAYYWMTGYPSTYTLYTRSTSAVATDTGTQIVTADQGYVSSFQATTDRIYWVHRPAQTTTLVSVPLAGGTPVEVPGSVVSDTAPLYAVGNTLYFVRNVGTAPENGVYKYTPGDAAATQLVQTQPINNMIADQNALYYTMNADGTVYKASLAGGKNGVGIDSGFSGLFGGQDASFLYTYAGWGGSDGAIKKFLK